MASELQELFAELNKVAGEEKKKFAEKVKADSDLQSMFSQLSEIKKENDKEKEKIEAKYAVPKIEEAKFNLLDELINISNAVQNPEPESTLAELPKDTARGERIEVEELSDTVKEILPEEEKKSEPIVELTTKHIKKSNLNEAKEEEKLEREFKRFKELVTKQLGSLGGGGAVNIRDLDDVDRTTALVDGKFLKYRSSDGKFIGAEASGGSGDVSAGVIELEGSTDQLVLDGTDASSTDAGDQITQEVGTEDYVLGKDGYINDDGFEWVNDNNTSTTVDDVNTYVTLTNSRKGSSLSQYLPEGVTRIWDDTNNKFYFNQLERKDWLIIRCGLKINPTVHNIRIVVRLLVTQKHNGTFALEAPATVLGPSGAGITYDPEFIITFYVGDLEGYETTDTYGEIQVQGDGPFAVEDFDILTIKG